MKFASFETYAAPIHLKVYPPKWYIRYHPSMITIKSPLRRQKFRNVYYTPPDKWPCSGPAAEVWLQSWANEDTTGCVNDTSIDWYTSVALSTDEAAFTIKELIGTQVQRQWGTVRNLTQRSDHTVVNLSPSFFSFPDRQGWLLGSRARWIQDIDNGKQDRDVKRKHQASYRSINSSTSTISLSSHQ